MKIQVASRRTKRNQCSFLELLGGFVVALTAVWMSGCSVIGFAVGAAHDRKDWVYERVSNDSLSTLESGDALRVYSPHCATNQVIFDRYDADSKTLMAHDGQNAPYTCSVEARTKIERLEPRTSSGNAKWLGFGCGLALDTAAVLAWALSVSSVGGSGHW